MRAIYVFEWIIVSAFSSYKPSISGYICKPVMLSSLPITSLMDSKRPEMFVSIGVTVIVLSTMGLLQAIPGAIAQCPEADLIRPCECNYDVEQGTDLFCGNITSTSELFQVFSQDFPTNTLARFWAWGSGVESLPAGIFSDKTFEDINIGNTPVSFIAPGLFASEGFSARLLSLFATGAKLNNFFELGILQLMPNLRSLSLGNNGIQRLPTRIDGGRHLEAFFLDGNNLASIAPDTFSTMPNLTTLDLSGNSIVELDSNVFAPLTSLLQLYMNNNGLQRFQPDSLAFNSDVLDYVDLRGNRITSLEGALSGKFGTIRLDLRGNEITEFPESAYKPILDAFLGSHMGKLFLDENPITCGCEMEWLLANEDLEEDLMMSYLTHIAGYCPDGTSFGDLVPDNFTSCALC